MLVSLLTCNACKLIKHVDDTICALNFLNLVNLWFRVRVPNQCYILRFRPNQIFLCNFLAVPWVCLQFVIVVFPDHTHLLFFLSALRCRNQIPAKETKYLSDFGRSFGDVLFFRASMYV